MSYKELKAATEEISAKYSATKRHLHNVLQTL